MVKGRQSELSITDPVAVAGTDRFEAMPPSFQYFAEFWHEQADGSIPSIEVLDRSSARSPLYAKGIIFAAELGAEGEYGFRIQFAGDDFDYYFGRNVTGYRIDDLFRPDAVASAKARYSEILRSRQPSYSHRRRSWVTGREIIRVERIYAPFTDGNGEPAFLAGLSYLSYD